MTTGNSCIGFPNPVYNVQCTINTQMYRPIEMQNHYGEQVQWACVLLIDRCCFYLKWPSLLDQLRDLIRSIDKHKIKINPINTRYKSMNDDFTLAGCHMAFMLQKKNRMQFQFWPAVRKPLMVLQNITDIKKKRLVTPQRWNQNTS